MVAVSLKKKNFFKQKTAYEINFCLVGSEMCIRDSVGVKNTTTGDTLSVETAPIKLEAVSYTHLTLPTTPYV